MLKNYISNISFCLTDLEIKIRFLYVSIYTSINGKIHEEA